MVRQASSSIESAPHDVWHCRWLAYTLTALAWLAFVLACDAAARIDDEMSITRPYSHLAILNDSERL